MAISRSRATIDGINGFRLFGEDFEGSNFYAALGLNAFTGNRDGYAATVTLRGSWGTPYMDFNSDQEGKYAVAIIDQNDGGERGIQVLRLGQGTTDVTLTDTRINFIRGGTYDTKIDFGTERVSAVELYEGSHTLTVDDGKVNMLRTSEGDDSLFLSGDGDIDFVDLASGENVIDVREGGSVSSVRAYDGDDRVVVRDDSEARKIDLSGGNNTLDIGGAAFVEYINTDHGNDSLTVADDAQVRVAVLEDGNDTVVFSSSRAMHSLSLGGGDNKLTVRGDDGSNFIESVVAFGDSDTFLVREDGGVGSILMGNGNNRLTVDGDNAQVNSAIGYDGNDAVVVRNGAFLGQANLYNGNNKITLFGNGTFVEQLDMNDGNDKLIVNAGARLEQVDIGDGNNVVDVQRGGEINFLVSGDGDDLVRVILGTDEGRIRHMDLRGGDDEVLFKGENRSFFVDLGRGENTLRSADGHIETIKSYGGSNTIAIGPGGAGFLDFGSDETEIHTITAEGFVGAARIRDASTTDITLNGGATSVRLGDGDDTVRLLSSDPDASGYVEHLATGNGDDTVILNNGRGSDALILGNGDDKIVLYEVLFTASVRGRSGIDTADLSKQTGGVTVDLNDTGLQDVRAYDGDGGETPLNLFQFISVENLIGTKRSDQLTGNATDNSLWGGKAGDSLSGEEGNDTLVGGKGKDVLSGGDGEDTFRFNRKDGSDTIVDFEVGIDRIAPVGAKRLGDLNFKPVGEDVEISYAKVKILIEDSTVNEMRDAANFDF